MQRLFWRVATVFVLVLPISTGAESSRWEKLAAAGEEAYKRGVYDEAEGLLVSALKEAETFPVTDPRRVESLTNLAEI